MNVLFTCIVFRLFSVLAVQTYFVADEYWQSLEVAHASTFGYGYLTWEFAEGIRSYVYPACFTVIYKFLDWSSTDFPIFLIYIPRTFQAILSALSDYCFVYLCYSFNLNKSDIWLTVLCDWFSFYCGSRTIINTFESNLITVGLYLFPWRTLHPSAKPDGVKFLFCFVVSIICYVRPTAILIWGPFLLLWLIKCRQVRLKFIIRIFLLPLCASVVSCVMVDSIFYKKISLTPLSFLYFNIFKGIASFYGSHPFHWYFSQGLPVVLGLFIFPFYKQTYTSLQIALNGNSDVNNFMNRVNSLLIYSLLSSLCLLSFVKHKEFRFLLPLMPMMKIISIQGLSSFGRGKRKSIFTYLVFVGFIVLSSIFGQLHQRGSLSVMRTLENDATARPNNTSILILTPCHATPLYSHLHVNIPVRFITCHPPITADNIDESQVFFDNPLSWLQLYLQSNVNNIPSHIVMFDGLVDSLHGFLSSSNYTKAHTFFHTLFPGGRVGKYVIVYKLIL